MVVRGSEKAVAICRNVRPPQTWAMTISAVSCSSCCRADSSRDTSTSSQGLGSEPGWNHAERCSPARRSRCRRRCEERLRDTAALRATRESHASGSSGTGFWVASRMKASWTQSSGSSQRARQSSISIAACRCQSCASCSGEITRRSPCSGPEKSRGWFGGLALQHCLVVGTSPPLPMETGSGGASPTGPLPGWSFARFASGKTSVRSGVERTESCQQAFRDSGTGRRRVHSVPKIRLGNLPGAAKADLHRRNEHPPPEKAAKSRATKAAGAGAGAEEGRETRPVLPALSGPQFQCRSPRATRIWSVSI